MSERSKKATMEVEEVLGEALRLAIDQLQEGSVRYTTLVDQVADAIPEPVDIKRAARLAVACGAVLQLVALGYARVDGNGNVSLKGG